MWCHLVVPTDGKIRRLPAHGFWFLEDVYFYFPLFIFFEDIILCCVIYIYIF